MYSWYCCLVDARGRRRRSTRSAWAAVSMRLGQAERPMVPSYDPSGGAFIEDGRADPASWQNGGIKSTCGAASFRAEHGPLQVPRFRDGEHLGMVLPLAEDGPKHQAPAAVGGRRGEHVEVLGTADVEGARGGEQMAARSEEAHGSEVDLVVAAE